MRHKRAFTLTELTVLLALTAVVACLVLPVVAQVRGPDAQKLRSTANMRLHGQILALYAMEHRGEVLNPFAGPTPRIGVFNIRPPWAHGVWPMRRDGYAYHWGPLIRQYYADYELIDVFAAPSDLDTFQTIQYLIDIGQIDNWVADISYWYSPTMFFSDQRFASADGGQSDNYTPGGGSHQTMLRRNSVDDMLFPSRKVVLLERQDFTTAEKLLFSHPDARVGLLLGDGAVMESNNPPLYHAIAADPSLAPSGGYWADNWGLQMYNMNNAAAPGKLLEDQQDLYWAFYMWTREGIRGRDLF